jgi:hypothetical protein
MVDHLFSWHTQAITGLKINPYPANVENRVELLIMPGNGRWDLTQHLKV